MKDSTIAKDKTTVFDLGEPYTDLDAAHGLRPFYLDTDLQSSALVQHICERIESLDPEILSFDVFDTALLRQAKSEARRFLDVSGLFVERLQADGLGSGIDSIDGLVARALAARSSYGLARAYHGNREGRLAEIARIASDLLGHPNQSVAYLEEEMAYEARSLTANPLVDLLRRTFPEKRIVFISDMYLEGDRIRELLSHHLEDVHDAPLFASTDGLGSKRSGGLFKNSANRLDAEPERILHFGDNFGSDYRKAKAAGWQAIYLPLPQAELDHRKQCFEKVCETVAGRGINLKRYLAFNT